MVHPFLIKLNFHSKFTFGHGIIERITINKCTNIWTICKCKKYSFLTYFFFITSIFLISEAFPIYFIQIIPNFSEFRQKRWSVFSSKNLYFGMSNAIGGHTSPFPSFDYVNKMEIKCEHQPIVSNEYHFHATCVSFKF